MWRVASLQAGGFKLTMAMAPSHEDQQGQPEKKLLKFAIIIIDIQTLLKRYMWV
jgi:hypothetical protein